MLPLGKASLTERAAEQIREEILSQRWAVGEKVPNESALCAMLSISRGTVREAVRVLVSHGYLETRQGSGTYVRATRDLTGPLSVSRRVGLRDQYETRVLRSKLRARGWRQCVRHRT
jgi:DNA-binding GntR family transcriptional regulator